MTLPEHWKKETGSMPGKKPKERQRYMMRVNDTLVEVTRAVYPFEKIVQKSNNNESYFKI